jgi:arsenate reductase (thioredoxin)
MTRILFLCVENANRSQMAEAFARIHGAGVVEAGSAGSRPAERVGERAIAAMAEKGYDLSVHTTKHVNDLPGRWDWVVTMGCGDVCPWAPAKGTIDWDLPDPRDLTSEAYAEVRDEIERRVVDLIRRLPELEGR